VPARCTMHWPAGTTVLPARNWNGTFATRPLLPNCADTKNTKAPIFGRGLRKFNLNLEI